MVDLPMSMSPLPPIRSSGDLTSRSSLCATPFLIEKLAESSEKSVLSLLSAACPDCLPAAARALRRDRKSTRLNSSHGYISYAVFCLKKKKTQIKDTERQI